MANLTRDQFVKLFGMSPEEFAKQNPDRVIKSQPQSAGSSTTVINGQRRTLYDDPGVIDTVKNVAQARRQSHTNPQNERETDYVSDAERLVQSQGREFTPVESFLNTINKPLEQGQKNVMGGVLAIPSAVPGIVGIARHGIPAVVEGLTSDSEDGKMSAIGDAFMNRVMPPEAQKRLQEDVVSAALAYKVKNPNATDADLAKFKEEYQNSDEFYKHVLDVMPTDLSLAMRGQWWANDMVGLGKRPDQMTVGDEAMQIVGQSLVGLPAGVVNNIQRRLTGVIGEKATSHILTKIAARTAEVVTPMTLPLTPGNVALNTGVGILANDAIRMATGDDTLLNLEAFVPDKMPDPEEMAAGAGITGLAVISLPGVIKATKQVANDAAQRAVSALKGSDHLSAGPSLEKQASDLDTKLSPMTGIADSAAPVRQAAQMYKSAGDTEVVQRMDAVMSSVSSANRIQHENNALFYGHLEGLAQPTVPITQIKSTLARLSREDQQLFDQYIYAVMRKQDNTVYERSIVDQVRKAFGDVQAAQLTGNKNSIKAAQNRLIDLQQKYNAFLQDTPLPDPNDPTKQFYPSRPSMEGWSRQQMNDIITRGENHQVIKQLGDAVKKVSNDLADYLHVNGVISAEEAQLYKRNRPMYVQLQERDYPDANPVMRNILLFRDRFKRANTDQASFINTATRDVTGEGAQVNNPKSALAALQETMVDAVRNVAINNARREIVETFDAMPGARGHLLRPFEFNVGNAKSAYISKAQFARLYPRGLKNQDKYIQVFKDGKVSFWEFGEPGVTQALKFAPIATVPIIHESRKFFQQMTTGLAAPWFAPVAFLRDVGVAGVAKQKNRTFGIIHSTAMQLSRGTILEKPVDALVAQVFDPTGVLGAAAAIPYQIGLRTAHAIGTKIGADLATNSGVFHAIAQSGPTGQRLVNWVGTSMITAWDRSYMNVMSRNMSTSLSALNDISKVKNDFVSHIENSAWDLTKKAFFEPYKAAIESIQMAARTSFFYQNYAHLELKYGVGKVPQREIDKLAHETRAVTGDLSKQSGNKYVQMATDVVPYGNAILQGTRHILSAALPEGPLTTGVANKLGANIRTDRNQAFWSQLTTGILLPKIAALGFLSQWQGAEDYWFNTVPAWQQFSTIPFPSMELLNEWYDTGQLPKFDPNKLNMLPLAPELSFVTEPVIAGLRAVGIVGKPSRHVPHDTGDDLKNAFAQLTSFGTHPLISGLFAAAGSRIDVHSALSGDGLLQPINPAAAGGANADMQNHNSEMSSTLVQMIGALAGTAVQIGLQALDVGQNTYEASGDMLKAADRALGTASAEAKRRLPQIDVPGLFNARERYYTQTADSDYVYKTRRDLEPIIGSDRQISVENDTSGRLAADAQLGLDTPQKLKDPMLRAISFAVYDTLKRKGPYKEASEAYSEIRNTLSNLDASRYKMSEDQFAQNRNVMIKKQQQFMRVQSLELQKLERQLQQQVGRRFIQRFGVPFSFKSLAEAVRKDVE